MDKRVKKTKLIIKQTLSDLISLKKYDVITITELCEEAHINRGTFYLHFKSVVEAVKEFENDIFFNLMNIIIKNHEKNFDYQNMMIDIANYIKSERQFIKAMLSNNGDIHFINNIKKQMQEGFVYEGNDVITNNEPGYLGHAFATFIISGAIGVFEDWVNNDCKDEICDLILPFEVSVLRLNRIKKLVS